MSKNYARLTLAEHIEIEKLLTQNISYAEIGRRLNRSRSSIQREVLKNGHRDYKALNALHTCRNIRGIKRQQKTEGEKKEARDLSNQSRRKAR